MKTKDISLVEWIRFLYGDPAIVFSALLRSMIIPTKGCELYVADFSKIEVAVLWWVSNNVPGLKVLNAGLDPYKYMAAANTGRKYKDIPDEGDDRQLGKAQVLGCGFGMGKDKFRTTAWDMYRLKLSEKQAKAAVDNYREANAAVPELWKAYENAAIAAIENKEKRYKTGKCIFQVERGFLWITLPSGRKLAYRKPRLSWRETEWGPRRTIEFLGLAPSKKSLVPERTWGGTLTENIVQAVARDLMMPAMLRLEKSNYRALLMVHDEGICEREKGTGSVEDFVKILCERPVWADSKLPIEAKGWKGPRYRK